MREKVGKSRNTVFFQWLFVAPEGRKIGSLKRRVRSHLGRWEMKNCTPLWRKAHLKCKSAKTAGFRALLDVQMSFCVVGARDYAPCQKWDKTSGFCSRFKSVGRRGAFEEDLERCISRGTRGTRDMFMRDVRRPGHWFPERVCILEHQIFRFAKMILRDRCSTSLG